MDLLQVDSVQICPWALREGIILRQLDVLAQPSLPASSGMGVGDG